MTALAEPAIARQVVAAVRSSWQQEGWRIFLSDRGRWWATTLKRPAVMPGDYWKPRHTVMAPDAVDADTYGELADKLRKKTQQ